MFDALAVEHGDRWSELPLEAMLTLGSAGSALAAAWPALATGDREGAGTLLRLALDRYSRHGVGDAVILAPLVELVYFGGNDLGNRRRYAPRGGMDKQVQELVLAWLRGLVTVEAGNDPLRERVRDALLDARPARHDKFAVEVLALLGPDLDGRAEAFLRNLADEWRRFAGARRRVSACRTGSRPHPPRAAALTDRGLLPGKAPDRPLALRVPHPTRACGGTPRRTGSTCRGPGGTSVRSSVCSTPDRWRHSE